MEKYPGRVCSKPVFTACPPAIFSGADFALIPSRDEPFGLVAVEFGRKGALAIGCKTGGLGNMPGWWYTMNSASASHLLSQFELACRRALKSSEKVRAQLRARAAKQRFPVAVWVKRLDTLQSKCIYLSNKLNKRNRLPIPQMEPAMDLGEAVTDAYQAAQLEPINIETFQRRPTVLRRGYAAREPPPFRQNAFDLQDEPNADGQLVRNMSLGRRRGPGARTRNDLEALHEENDHQYFEDDGSLSNTSEDAFYVRDSDFDGRAPDERDFDQYIGTWGRVQAAQSSATLGFANTLQQDDPRIAWPSRTTDSDYYDSRASSSHDDPYQPDEYQNHDGYGYAYPECPSTAYISGRSNDFSDERISLSHDAYMGFASHDSNPLLPPNLANRSRLSVLSLTDLEKDRGLQHSTIKKGDAMFTDADGKAKAAFVQSLKKGLTAESSKKKFCIETFLMDAERRFFEAQKDKQIHGKKHRVNFIDDDDEDLGTNVRLRGMRRFLAMRVGDWPVYTILAALGQVLSANSYQLTLLAGDYQKTKQLYIINTIFALMSVFWYFIYRKVPAIWVLSVPFILYGFSFILVGLPHISRLGNESMSRHLTNSASYIYASASASGSLFFALNFGAEGGIEVKGWVIRACIIQGLQQIWSSAMWYWGNGLNNRDSKIFQMYVTGVPMSVAVIVWGLGALLIFFSIAMFSGLPKYYRQAPGNIPAFYRSLYRRKVIVWFLISQILSNFWLALAYTYHIPDETSVVCHQRDESFADLARCHLVAANLRRLQGRVVCLLVADLV